MSPAEFEATIKKLNPVSMAKVAMRTGGFAYVRQPTQEEYDSFQALSDGGGPDEKRIAFARYVKACFVGAINAGGTEVSFETVATLEGPAFVSGGALGHAVNKLAGSVESQTTFF